MHMGHFGVDQDWFRRDTSVRAFDITYLHFLARRCYAFDVRVDGSLGLYDKSRTKRYKRSNRPSGKAGSVALSLASSRLQ